MTTRPAMRSMMKKPKPRKTLMTTTANPDPDLRLRALAGVRVQTWAGERGSLAKRLVENDRY